MQAVMKAARSRQRNVHQCVLHVLHGYFLIRQYQNCQWAFKNDQQASFIVARNLQKIGRQTELHGELEFQMVTLSEMPARWKFALGLNVIGLWSKYEFTNPKNVPHQTYLGFPAP